MKDIEYTEATVHRLLEELDTVLRRVRWLEGENKRLSELAFRLQASLSEYKRHF